MIDSMIIVYAILAYLIGSVPSGLIIGKIFLIRMYVNTVLKISVLPIHIGL